MAAIFFAATYFGHPPIGVEVDHPVSVAPAAWEILDVKDVDDPADPSEIFYIGQVEPTEEGDDGLREFTEDQVIGFRKARR
jgi:hypothetical protein